MSEYKWQIPPEGGHMDAADGIYFQNMTMLEVEERLKVNDVSSSPLAVPRLMARMPATERIPSW